MPIIPARMGAKRWLPVIGAAVALAIGITVFAALSTPPNVDQPKVTDPAVSAMRLASQTREAASRNDTELALSLASRALQADPANSEARQLKASLEATSVPAESPGDSGASGGQATTSDPFDKPVADILVLLPSSFRTWSRGEALSKDKSAVVTFEPRPTDAEYGRVVRAAVYANDAGGSAAATKMAVDIHKRVYPKNRATVTVGVVKDAKFGTDGKHLAAVSFARGRYAFEIILTSPPGVDLGKLKNLAVEVASSVPASK